MIDVKDVVRRFWVKVDICIHGKECKKCCWMWTASLVGREGMKYGQLYIGTLKGRRVRKAAHVVSWKIYNNMRRINENEEIMHSCDNPPCVNPHHLSKGTNKDNVDDMVQKGRQFHPKGELHGEAKLTEQKVLWLRRRYLKIDMTQEEFGKILGVSSVKVGQILRGEYWTHIDDGLQSRIDIKLRGRRNNRPVYYSGT